MTGRFKELENWMLAVANIAKDRYGKRVTIFDDIPWEGYFGENQSPSEAVETAAKKYKWKAKEEG